MVWKAEGGARVRARKTRVKRGAWAWAWVGALSVPFACLAFCSPRRTTPFGSTNSGRRSFRSASHPPTGQEQEKREGGSGLTLAEGGGAEFAGGVALGAEEGALGREAHLARTGAPDVRLPVLEEACETTSLHSHIKGRTCQGRATEEVGIEAGHLGAAAGAEAEGEDGVHLLRPALPHPAHQPDLAPTHQTRGAPRADSQSCRSWPSESSSGSSCIASRDSQGTIWALEWAHRRGSLYEEIAGFQGFAPASLQLQPTLRHLSRSPVLASLYGFRGLSKGWNDEVARKFLGDPVQ